MIRSSLVLVSALYGSSASAAHDAEALVQWQVGVHQQSQAELAAGVEAHAAVLAHLFSGSILRYQPQNDKNDKKDNKVKVKSGCTDDDRVRLSYFQTKMEQPLQLAMKQLSKMKLPSEYGHLPENIPIVQVPTDLDIDLFACDIREFFGVQGVRWNNVEQCLAKTLKVSEGCATCPISYMRATMGGDAVTMPFSCVPKCTHTLATCTIEEPDNNCLKTMVPCLQCLAPKVGKLESCLGADDIHGEAKLRKTIDLFKKFDLEDIGGIDTLFEKLMAIDVGGNSTAIDIDPLLKYLRKTMNHDE